VEGSISGDDFNALDPAILVDADSSIWRTYGSYWSGIKQRQVGPATGRLLDTNPTVHSSAEPANLQFDPIEGTSEVQNGNFFYLFLSLLSLCVFR
jgi:arabinan endo-1,5-alpha-L-arabinosidase